MKCRYCDKPAVKTLVWLKDKQRRPARIKLPWCGCDLQVALKRFWTCPYTVREGDDYETEALQEENEGTTVKPTDPLLNSHEFSREYHAEYSVNRLSPHERYNRDVSFKALVDTMYHMILACDYTPTELREAAILAATYHIQRHPSPFIMPRDEVPRETLDALQRVEKGSR